MTRTIDERRANDAAAERTKLEDAGVKVASPEVVAEAQQNVDLASRADEIDKLVRDVLDVLAVHHPATVLVAMELLVSSICATFSVPIELFCAKATHLHHASIEHARALAEIAKKAD